MNQSQVAKLLNRSLTSSEVTNFDMYLKIAQERLEQLVCFSLCDDSVARTYNCRYNYHDLYVDPFTSINSITVDDEVTTEYTIKQGDKYNGTWYDIIEFDDKMTGDKVVVDAVWGFDCIPYDLQFLIAKLFAQVGVEQQADDRIKSKKIEDFSVTYKDGATFDEFVASNQATINKYSHCNIGEISHGRIHTVC